MKREPTPDADTHVIDLGGSFVSAGLIDLQVYGSGGHMFGGKPTARALLQMEQDFCEQGTTGFYATVATNTDEVFQAASSVAIEYYGNRIGNFWGLHFEGPFLNSLRRGAHPEELIKPINMSDVQKYVRSSEGHLKMMTLAAELVPFEEVGALQYMVDSGMVLSCGHSNATYDEFLRCADYRSSSHPNAVCAYDCPPKLISAVTHLFNAMPPMHHRAPGCIPAMMERRPYCSIIVDGTHVDYAMVRLAKRALGDRLFLITDAVTATEEGVYQHRLQAGTAAGPRYVMPDGTLSGSALSMMDAVHNCVKHCGITLQEAVRMASLYPARLVGLESTKGKIAPGFDADLVVFNDEYEPQITFIAGKRVYSRV